MKILKYLIVIGIITQTLLLSGCSENRSNTISSESIESNLSESDVNASEDSESIDSNLFDSYVAACENDNAEACFKAGKVYSSEAYKEPDYDQETAATKVAQFYLKSCELGFAEGCTEYGMMFNADMQRDESKDAKYYFEKACDGGDIAGCNLFKMAP